jgi:RNA polymerase sigma factor (sigma-70 family)
MTIARSDTAEEFLIENRRKLLVWALRILPVYEDAEDCVQAASLRIFRHWDQHNPARSRNAWALQVVTNQALDVLRKRKARFHDAHAPIEPERADRSRDLSVPSAENSIVARLTLLAICNAAKPWERAAILWMMTAPHADAANNTMKTRKWRLIRNLRARYPQAS